MIVPIDQVVASAAGITVSAGEGTCGQHLGAPLTGQLVAANMPKEHEHSVYWLTLNIPLTAEQHALIVREMVPSTPPAVPPPGLKQDPLQNVVSEGLVF